MPSNDSLFSIEGKFFFFSRLDHSVLKCSLPGGVRALRADPGFTTSNENPLFLNFQSLLQVGSFFHHLWARDFLVFIPFLFSCSLESLQWANTFHSYLQTLPTVVLPLCLVLALRASVPIVGDAATRRQEPCPPDAPSRAVLSRKNTIQATCLL